LLFYSDRDKDLVLVQNVESFGYNDFPKIAVLDSHVERIVPQSTPNCIFALARLHLFSSCRFVISHSGAGRRSILRDPQRRQQHPACCISPYHRQL